MAGRKAKGVNRGFFFRKGRSWVAVEGTKLVPLRDMNGNVLKDERINRKVVNDAYARFTADQLARQRCAGKNEDITALELAHRYLASIENGKQSTFKLRAGYLFDFCLGLPRGLRERVNAGEIEKAEANKRRIHAGYGSRLVSDLIPADVEEWVKAHPGWQKSQRTAINAVKRFINYGVKGGIISENPIKGLARPKDNLRPTYITPEQEAAMMKLASPALAWAVKICIRVGCRYGCEYTKLTAAHISETTQGLEWRFQPHESKNHKLRIIRVKDPEIVAYIRQQMKLHPEGPVFHAHRGQAWTEGSLSQNFRNLIGRCKRQGVIFDANIRPYSMRHTFAKRTLQGFWTGKPTNIETLAHLMGNTRQICWESYAEWCETYTEPLWRAI